ncbi:MAG: helix-turn-helix transcriptional regulator [Candidatus Gastranaerophilales bacterium]
MINLNTPNEEILRLIADNIRIERLKKRISQEKLAETIDISAKYLNMIENRKANPTIIIIIKLCLALDIELNSLLKTI